MNLFHMLLREDPNLIVEGEVLPAKHEIGGDTWRGLKLHPGAGFTIPDVRRFVNFRAFPPTCGWMVQSPRNLELEISFHRHGTDEELSSTRLGGGFQLVPLPWPRATAGQLDLRVRTVGKGRGSLFLANHRALSRQWLIDLAVGRGVELGPGPQPQILPSDKVDVVYIEQMPPAEWNQLYNKSGKFPVRPELWDNYVVGEASNLPVPDGSLDFIFGSHVFEHLANPIGHLNRWKRKLAPGGKVICVVPDLGGTKDAVQERSTLEEWRQELEDDVWLPVERHYLRHLRRAPDHPSVIAAMERNESIHAHYYDNLNCQILLEFAVSGLGYADYVIEYTPNHKDFHFVLKNSA